MALIGWRWSSGGGFRVGKDGETAIALDWIGAVVSTSISPCGPSVAILSLNLSRNCLDIISFIILIALETESDWP